MALYKNITNVVEIPHEPGNSMVLRKLTWKQLEKAAEARSNTGASRMRTLGGELVAALQSVRTDSEEAKKAQADPLNQYDRATLLEMGVGNWMGPKYDDTLFSKEELDNLDPDTADWAARTIVESSRTKTRDEQKN